MSDGEMLIEFERCLRGDGKSERTIEAYVGDARHFLNYLHMTCPKEITDINRADITQFRRHLLMRALKPASINKTLYSINSFCDFLKECGFLSPNVRMVVPRRDIIRIATGSEREVEIYSEEEVLGILKFVADSKNCALRNRLIVHILLYTGCRVTELVNLRIQDINISLNSMMIRGKGGKLREIPLRRDLWELIEEYVEGERSHSKFADSQYLFVSQRASSIHRDTVNTILEQIEKSAGFHFHLRPHKFRHTFCTRLIARGVSLITVSRLAGHSSINLTFQFYINTSRREKENAINLL